MENDISLAPRWDAELLFHEIIYTVSVLCKGIWIPRIERIIFHRSFIFLYPFTVFLFISFYALYPFISFYSEIGYIKRNLFVDGPTIRLFPEHSHSFHFLVGHSREKCNKLFWGQMCDSGRILKPRLPYLQKFLSADMVNIKHYPLLHQKYYFHSFLIVPFVITFNNRSFSNWNSHV